MADCRVKSCCCCCSLKCFGYFIGLLNLLVYVIASAALGYLFAVLLSTLAGKRSEFGEGLDRDISQGIMILLLIGLLFLIPICCFLAYVSFSFIKGISEWNYKKMTFFRNISLFNVILSLLSLTALFFNKSKIDELVSELFGTLIYFYFVVCINSLYLDIKEENLRMTNTVPLQVISVQKVPLMNSHPTHV